MVARVPWRLIAASAVGICFCFARVSFAAFINFETAPVHPIALAPDGRLLAVCNLPDYRVELFDVTGGVPLPLGDVPVGVDPVSLRFRTTNELWVVNHISSTVSIVDVTARCVVATLDTKGGAADVVFAGSPQRAFVSCAKENTVQVFDPDTRQTITNLTVEGERPKAMAVSPDGQHVYVAIFESGNASTILSGAVNDRSGPYGGQNPPPNSGSQFSPPINANLQIDPPLDVDYLLPPPVSHIVKKNPAGRWLDDNTHDWTEMVSGTNAAASGRPMGWDMPDRDLAVIDATTFGITYAVGLMNICMDVAVNPASGTIAVVGTDATNERRFEPNLRGTFARVHLALVKPTNLTKTIVDLNPHLDYSTATTTLAERDQSIGDPRGILWRSDGTRGYVTGTGSRNLVVIDADGNRTLSRPVELGQGPTGLALDESRHRLYALNRFSATIAVLDSETLTVLANVALFDPTPAAVKAGRKHFYDTRLNSGLGQLSCASCHVDARFDRLAWDLGNPAGQMRVISDRSGEFGAGVFHPMKGPMVTQTLQDIIVSSFGFSLLHWRGDRAGIGEFNATFTDLLGRDAPLTTNEMQEFKDFLATIHFPPNRLRNFDNSLPEELPLAGHPSVNPDGSLSAAPLPIGNARRGRQSFLEGEFPVFSGGNCASCHEGETGRNGFRDFVQREQFFKIVQLRNMADKVGMDLVRTQSRAGFGFRFDGRDDSLTRFLAGVIGMTNNQEIADVTAFLLSFSGASIRIGRDGEHISLEAPPAVGRQTTLHTPGANPLVTAMVLLAASSTNDVDVVAHGVKAGLNRGWFYSRATARFESDRNGEELSTESLLALAATDTPLTFTVVPVGTGARVGIDRDADGRYDRTELDDGTNPLDPCSSGVGLTPIILPNLEVHPGSLVTLAVGEAYAAEPCQKLSFELLNDPPPEAAIDPASGLFTWPVPSHQPAGVTDVAIRIQAHGSPPHVATNTFQVRVTPLEIIEITRQSGGEVFLRWRAIAGHTYDVQYKGRLEETDWRTLGQETTLDMTYVYLAQTATQQFYRIVEVHSP